MGTLLPDGTTRQFARYIVNAKYEDIPAEVLDVMKMNILDITGATIAGYDKDGVEELLGLLKVWGGAQEASVLHHDMKLPAHWAACANAVMARALDFEDNEENGAHPTASLWPTVVACAEKVGNVSGKDMLLAFTIGRDVCCRVNFANLDYQGFDPTTASVIFGCTAIACKLYGLDEEQTISAFGFTLNLAGGTFQSNMDGVLNVRINQGMAAHNAIVAAEFAKAGLTGVKNVFEGVYGYYHLFGHDKVLESVLLDGLGEKFLGQRVNFKRWPSCAQTAASTDIGLELVADGVDYKDIDHIDVRLSPSGFNLVGKKFSIGTNPAVDTQFNASYCLANALVRKHPVFDQFNVAENVKCPDVLDLIARISVAPEPSFVTMPVDVDDSDPLAPVLRNRGHYLRAEVDVYLKDGTKISKAADWWKGYSQNPLSLDELIAKYWDSIEYAGGIVSKDVAQQVLDICLNIENLANGIDYIDLLRK